MERGPACSAGRSAASRCSVMIRRRLLVALLSLFAAAGLASVAGADPSFELFPGAVVDDRAILVMQPGSSIAVVDVATGGVRCSTRHAARPLLVNGDRMLGQTESGGSTLRLWVFDYRRSGDWPSSASCELTPRHRIDVKLPAGMRTGIDQGIDGAFDVRARSDGATTLVEWSYRTSPAYPIAWAKTGGFHVDLDSGRVTPANVVTTPPKARALPPVPTSTPLELATGTMAIHVYSRTDGTKGVELAPDGSRGRASRRDLGIADLRALRLSSDDRHLLAASFARAAAAHQRYVWSVFDVETGERRGDLSAGRSGSPFFVRDSLIVYRDDRYDARAAGPAPAKRPVRLVAGDLSDGRELWSLPVRDTAYRGTRPPAQPLARGDETQQ